MSDETLEPTGSDYLKGNRFEVKRWNAVALWAWGKSRLGLRIGLLTNVTKILLWITVPSAGTILWTSALSVKQIKRQCPQKSVQ